jgi:hypothetical protein
LVDLGGVGLTGDLTGTTTELFTTTTDTTRAAPPFITGTCTTAVDAACLEARIERGTDLRQEMPAIRGTERGHTAMFTTAQGHLPGPSREILTRRAGTENPTVRVTSSRGRSADTTMGGSRGVTQREEVLAWEALAVAAVGDRMEVAVAGITNSGD